MKSLDPRVNRLPKTGQPGVMIPKSPLDQFGTFEVFVRPKEGKPFQHEGIVHSPDLEMAYIFAKETFTRRFTCHSLFVVDTRHVFVSPLTEGTIDVYDLIPNPTADPQKENEYYIFHLLKRGKQHIQAGTVMANSAEDAFAKAKLAFKSDKPMYNVWAIRTADIRFTNNEDHDLWNTLPEKKFRDAAEYKGGDKLKEFLERTGSN